MLLSLLVDKDDTILFQATLTRDNGWRKRVVLKNTVLKLAVLSLLREMLL
jgi:hypothetical protein